MRGSNFIDLTGKRFGRLIVIERVDNYVHINKNGKRRFTTQWLCKCDCGNGKITRGISLKSGHTKIMWVFRDRNKKTKWKKI